jgi:hypothetical protein
MIDLLVAGGVYFTIPLTVVALAVVGAAIKATLSIRNGHEDSTLWTERLFHLGLFGFVLGILSQAIGIYQMLSAIEGVGSVSPAIVAGGLKVSLIAPLYGLIIFVVALLMRLCLDWGARRMTRVTS